MSHFQPLRQVDLSRMSLFNHRGVPSRRGVCLLAECYCSMDFNFIITPPMPQFVCTVEIKEETSIRQWASQTSIIERQLNVQRRQ